MITRRDLLRWGAGGVAAAGGGGDVLRAAWAQDAAASAAAGRIKGSLAFQLYCLSGEDKSDPARFAEACKTLARLGFKGVELGPCHKGYGNGASKQKRDKPQAADPKAIGQAIRDAGLVITSSHMFPAQEMMGDKLKANIDWHQAAGNTILIISDTSRYISKSTKEAWLKFAEELRKIAETLKPLGMRTGYHSHGIDFKPVEDGDIPWFLVFGNTPEDVVMEIDYDNVRGYDALVKEAIRKFPGRGIRMHFKRQATVWDKWEKDDKFTAVHKELFDLYETVGKCEWYVIEDWAHQKGGWEALKGHVEFFRKMGNL
jgi:sugar phosphate isomerase/epimerase